MYGICGKRIAFNPQHVDYIQASKMMGAECTLVCFDSGKKVFVKGEYKDVYRMIDDALLEDKVIR